ncbi:type II toxin-antitoxin system PemK/MazF family toxin [Mobiluncus mulieris]|uniref:type II toxin-antitoxin system PemK/MazF family toxin n=1 Tax=Mobiluncus mulieris TaxID=2052 RepID=UPI0021E231F6|nr:type II toxin-antitoxin system PemK/MazF family toxin [Mobiluncus mulieris]MCU9996617.1 type II toxin-antitoxin system PemK/MazF family toxin [Mobiluncus mulieris]
MTPTKGREQNGRRPVLVISAAKYHDIIDALAIVVPISTTDRGWPNHIRLTDLARSSWAMTEQPRTIAQQRLKARIGTATPEELAQVLSWVIDFISL